MAHKKCKAVIVKITNVKDSDRYLTILTKELGLISVYAKRIRTKKNPLLSKSQLFTYAEFVLFENKGRYSLNEIDVIYQFRSLESDILQLTACAQVVELLLDQTHEIEEASLFFELFLRFAYALEKGDRNPYFLTSLAEMFILNTIGYTPVLNHCVRCGQSVESGQILAFDFNNAGVLCETHAKEEKLQLYSEVRNIYKSTYQLLQYLEQANLASIFQIQVSKEVEEEFYQFVSRYLQVRLDKSYDKFRFFRDFQL